MIKHIPLRLSDFGGGVFVCKNGDGYCKKCGKGVKQQNKNAKRMENVEIKNAKREENAEKNAKTFFA